MFLISSLPPVMPADVYCLVFCFLMCPFQQFDKNRPAFVLKRIRLHNSCFDQQASDSNRLSVRMFAAVLAQMWVWVALIAQLCS